MKLLMVMIVGFVLVGCKEQKCNWFNSVWKSTTDDQILDFRNLNMKEATLFTYSGTDGQACGNGTDLYVTVERYDFDQTFLNVGGFDHAGTFDWATIPPSQCSVLEDGASNPVHVVMKIECDYMVICEYNDTERFNCKSFEN